MHGVLTPCPLNKLQNPSRISKMEPTKDNDCEAPKLSSLQPQAKIRSRSNKPVNHENSSNDSNADENCWHHTEKQLSMVKLLLVIEEQGYMRSFNQYFAITLKWVRLDK